jgi:O-antigen ligase
VTACLVFCVIAVLAFGFGQISWFPIQAAPITAQIGGLMIFILTAGIFLVIGHQLNTVKELQWITWVFLACAALYVIGRFVTGIPSERIYRYFVREATLGCLFYVWVGAMATGQALFNTKLAKGWRVALGVLVVAIFYMNMGQSRFWLSGWLPMLVAVAAVLVIARPQFGGFIVICGIIIVLLNTQSVGGILSEGDNVYSTETRLAAWRIVGEIIKVNPLFGLGMANYYYYTPLFNMMGYNISFNSHNNYIDLVAQAGLLGLICFGWLVWEIWKLGLRVKNAVPEGFPRAYAYGALGGLVGTVFAGLLGDWVVPFVYNIGLNGFRASMLGWMFLGGLLVLEKLFIQPVDKSASV